MDHLFLRILAGNYPIQDCLKGGTPSLSFTPIYWSFLTKSTKQVKIIVIGDIKDTPAVEA